MSKTSPRQENITRVVINKKAKALYTVTKKDGLNPRSRKLGCPLKFKMFPGSQFMVRGSELMKAMSLMEDVCDSDALGSHAATWHRGIPRDKMFIWMAFANGIPIGMAGGYSKYSAQVKSHFMLSILCTKRNPPGGCSNVGTHLMHQVEKSVRKMGIPYIEIDSIDSAIRFYTRLGYVRSADPCASRADKAIADKKAKDLFDSEVQKYITAGKPIPQWWHIFNGRFYPGDGRTSGEVKLKKCVQKNKRISSQK